MSSTARALARTYNPQAYTDPWDAVEQYRKVMTYHSHNPNAGRRYLSRRFDIPEGRIREWLDGSQPAPVRAIRIAEDHGWLPTADGDLPVAIRQLAAWLLAAGSIDGQGYRPLFVLSNTDQKARLGELLDDVGVGMETIERDPGRSVEGVPATTPSILGRLMVALGVPTGNRLTDIKAVPPVLTDAPADAQRAAAATYCRCRAERWTWDDQYVITHRDAPQAYLRSLSDWLSSVTDTECTVTESSVQLPAEAATRLM